MKYMVTCLIQIQQVIEKIYFIYQTHKYDIYGLCARLKCVFNAEKWQLPIQWGIKKVKTQRVERNMKKYVALLINKKYTWKCSKCANITRINYLSSKCRSVTDCEVSLFRLLYSNFGGYKVSQRPISKYWLMNLIS